MRLLIVFLVLCSLLFGTFSSPTLARKKLPPGQKKKLEKIIKKPGKEVRKPVGSLTAAQKKKVKARVKNLSPAQRKEMNKALQAKLQRMKKAVMAAKITAQRRAILNAEIQRVSLELRFIMALSKTPPQPRLGKPQPKPKMVRRPGPQFGLSAGYIAGIPGAAAELRFHNPFDMIRTSIKLGLGYAQGKDTAGTTRKHALIILDGIYRMSPPQAHGPRSYVGLGLNYDAYTTGQKSGDLGYQAYYGMEFGRARGGQMFLEVGYGAIRTGFSPGQTGATALLGYKF